jgi:hypothetical protein
LFLALAPHGKAGAPVPQISARAAKIPGNENLTISFSIRIRSSRMPRLTGLGQHTDMIDRTESRLIDQERRNRARSGDRRQPRAPSRKPAHDRLANGA